MCRREQAVCRRELTRGRGEQAVGGGGQAVCRRELTRGRREQAVCRREQAVCVGSGVGSAQLSVRL